MLEDPHLGQFRGQAVKNLTGSVGGGIVHRDEFHDIGLLKYLADHLFNGSSLIINRHDD
jgi:hypothetical protein